MWRLADPAALFLWVIPILLCWWHLRARHRGRASILFSGGELLDGLPATWRSILAPRLHWLRYPGLFLLIFALARPQWGESIQEIQAYGVDLMMVLDVSATMAEQDMTQDGVPVSRLDAAKTVMAGFVKDRRNDRIGLIVFATESLTRCPLTLDDDLLTQTLDQVDLNYFPPEQRQTAIGNALASAVSRLWTSDARSQVVILLTDGANTAGNISPQLAADIAAEKGIRVHTIGFGSPGRSDVDEELLQQISKKTQGRFFRSTTLENLQQVYAEIDILEKSEVVVRHFHQWEERFHLFLWLGCGLILLETILRHWILRAVP